MRYNQSHVRTESQAAEAVHREWLRTSRNLLGIFVAFLDCQFSGTSAFGVGVG
jgi:hypothetical protein